MRRPPTWTWLSVVFLALSLSACTARLATTPLAESDPDAASPKTPTPGRPGQSGSPDEPVNPRPDPDAPAAPISPVAGHLRRLTPAQYQQTVRAALGDHYAPEDLPQFADDLPTIGLANDAALLRVTKVNINSLYDSIQRVAARAVQAEPRLRDCVAKAQDPCLDELVDELGLALWRRPLLQVERQELLAARARVAQAGATRAQQLEFILQALLGSVHMLFRPELGSSLQGSAYALTDLELASALSYTLWSAPPDQELMGLALAGQLRDPDTLRAQARRMAQDERAALAFAEFFVDYLKLEAIFSKDKAQELGLTPQARRALFEQIKLDLIDVFSSPQASLLDPFTLGAFRVDATTASFFGVPVTSPTAQIVAMDPAQRLGILSHPTFLSVHAGVGSSGIVQRGVFTLEQLLCVKLGTPPDDISGVQELPPGFDPERATSRELLHVQHSAQAACAGCHQIIDPAGYGFEHYDGAGRFRMTERGDLPIDASGQLRLGELSIAFQDSVDFIQALTQSKPLRQCLASKYLTYALGVAPGQAEQDAFAGRFDQSQGQLDALIEALIQTPSFTTRTPSKEL